MSVYWPEQPKTDGAGDLPRVLLVSPQPFFRLAGTPMNVRLMCQALADAGYAIDLLTFPHGERLELPQVRQRRVWPIPGLSNIPIGFSGTKIAYDVLMSLMVAWTLLRERYVAVHAIEEAAFFTLPLAWLRGLPGIIDLDSDLEHQLASHPNTLARRLAPPARLIRREVLRRAQAAVTVASHLTELVRRESPHTPVFELRDIPLPEMLSPPDPDAVATLRRELRLGAGPIGVYTGNFDRRQGVRDLIEAWGAVRRTLPTAQLVVVGGEAGEVEAMRGVAATCLAAAGIPAAQLDEAVIFTGKRSPAEMPTFMALADAVVSPRLEPLVTPFKIYSYMASGRPIVATALPTHQEVLDEQTAFLVDPSPGGLAQGLIRAFHDPGEAERRGRAARALVDERHNYRVFKQQIGLIYASLGRVAANYPVSNVGTSGR